MTWHQNQQGIGMVLSQLPVGGEDDLVFAFMGTGRDPYGPLAGLPLLTQGTGAGQQLLIDTQVELD
ncbi:hypothetical protein D3C72_2318540 [compost metagenome]